MVILFLFHWVDQKDCSLISILRDFPFSNLLRKNNMLSNSKQLSEIVNNLHPKEKFSVNFSKIVLFHWFDQKYLFPSNQNIPHDLSLFKLLRKIIFWVLISYFLRYHFLGAKREIFNEFPGKCLKRTENLFVCGSFWGRKQFLVIFVQFHGFDQKYLFPSNQNNSRDMLLFKLLRKITFWVINNYFLKCHFLDPKEKFSVNFWENVSKHQKSFV